MRRKKTDERVRRATDSRQLKYHHAKSRDRAFIKYPKGSRCKRYTEWLPGAYDSPESRAAFERSLGYYLQHGDVPPWVAGEMSTIVDQTAASAPRRRGPTVDAMCDEFQRHKETDYCHGEACHYRSAIKRLRWLYGKSPARAMGRRELREVRSLMVKAGNCRKTINGQIARLKAVFVWAAEEEMVPDEVPGRLASLRPLKRGKAAHDNPPVEPVSDEIVERTIKVLPPTAASLVRLLRVSGARSGELFSLRGQDIQRKLPDLWIYQPAEHKSAWRGHSRTIFFGPQAIEILRPILRASKPEELVFVRPQWEDYRNRNRHTIGTAWSKSSFGALIRRTCARFEIPKWHPHQLRHAKATEVYNRPGGSIAAAQRLLGHVKASTTEIYIQAQDDPAEQLARRFG